MDPKNLIDNDSYQVFLMRCPASIPACIGTHPWFVINKKGILSRYEVFFGRNQGGQTLGHLHVNFYSSPFQGLEVFPSIPGLFWKSRLIGYIEGEEARKIAEFIETTPKTYPFCEKYSLFGPNSNTYAQWVLDRSPAFKAKLPWNSFGKRDAAKIESAG